MKSKLSRMSITTRLFIIISFLLVISVIACGILMSVPITTLIRNNYINSSTRELELFTQTIDSTIEHISNYAISIASSTDVISAAKNHPDAPQDTKTRYELRNSVGRNILSIIGTNSDIYAYDLFSLSGIPFYISGTDMTPYLSALTSDFFNSCTASRSATFHGPYFISSSNSFFPVFFVTKVIADLETREIYGILLLVVKESRFSSLFPSVSNRTVSCYIVNNGGNIISSKNKKLIGKPLNEALHLETFDFSKLIRREPLSIDMDSGTRILVSEKTSSRTDWYTVLSTSMISDQETWLHAFSYLIVILLIIAVLMIFGAYFLSRQFTRPIHRLISYIEESTAEVSPKALPDPRGSIEIHQLHDSFNKLLEHIQNEQREKSSYEFQLIQSQIKPHFLNNTLMTIKSLIDLDMNETASDCIYAFASFYRLSLNHGNEILTIAEEVELSSHYMYIQHLRYIDRLTYSFSIDESIKQYYIPKMTLQPVLENAIYHGVKEKSAPGSIVVKGFEENNCIYFTVTDNGNGMTPEETSFLNQSFRLEKDSFHHENASFGLYSVNRRIQLLSGNQYGIFVSSEAGKYTCVTLKLAKLIEKKDIL